MVAPVPLCPPVPLLLIIAPEGWPSPLLPEAIPQGKPVWALWAGIRCSHSLPSEGLMCVCRCLLGALHGALSFHSGERSPGQCVCAGFSPGDACILRSLCLTLMCLTLLSFSQQLPEWIAVCPALPARAMSALLSLSDPLPADSAYRCWAERLCLGCSTTIRPLCRLPLQPRPALTSLLPPAPAVSLCFPFGRLNMHIHIMSEAWPNAPSFLLVQPEGFAASSSAGANQIRRCPGMRAASPHPPARCQHCCTPALLLGSSVQHPCSCSEPPEAGLRATCCHPGTAVLSPPTQCKPLLQAHRGSCPGQRSISAIIN